VRALPVGCDQGDRRTVARKKFRRGPEPLGAVMSRERSTSKFVAAQVGPIAAKDWEAAVGSRIAQRTRPSRLERGVLTVTVSSAAWSQELSLLSAAILEQLRVRGHALTALRFQVGTIEPPASSSTTPSPRKRVPLQAPLDPELASALAAVDDEELLAAIERAARTSLGVVRPKR